MLVIALLPQLFCHDKRGNKAINRHDCYKVPKDLAFGVDWSRQTQPSWIESILEGVRRPGAVLGLGPGAALQGLRETPTLLLMDWAFRTGMMQFGVFRGRKGS